MKKLIFLFALVLALKTFSQTHNDTITLLQQTAALYDLDFTQAEADSMIGNIVNWKRTYVRMHQQLPKNDLPYPFAFNPTPFGFTIQTNQQNIVWTMPSNVSLPKNKNELAFYTILQLASLIKNKKITSVELTRFFLDRLKKFGDSLQCVIS